jgi:hypothetical protein
MRSHVTYWNLAHAPILLIGAAPLYARMKWAAGIVKNAEAMTQPKRFRTDWAEKDGPGFGKEVRNMGRAGVVRNDRPAMRNQIHQLYRRRFVHLIIDIGSSNNSLKNARFFLQDFAPKSDNHEWDAGESINQLVEIS